MSKRRCLTENQRSPKMASRLWAWALPSWLESFGKFHIWLSMPSIYSITNHYNNSNMDGQLRLNSGDRKGSRFVIQLPFDMPPSNTPDSDNAVEIGEATAAASSIASVPPTLPPAREGEVMLVSRTSTNNLHKQSLTPRQSIEDITSAGSLHSVTSRGSAKSSKSDAERLIDAIQTPLAIGEPEPEQTALQRQNSKGGASHRSSSQSLSRSMSPTRLSGPFGRPAPLTRSASSPGVNDQGVKIATTPGIEYVSCFRNYLLETGDGSV